MLISSIAMGLSPFNKPAGIAAQSEPLIKTNPAMTWERFSSPEAAGFSSSGLDTLEQTLFTKPTTSLLIVTRDKIVYSYGDISYVSYLASARKSVLSILYGKYVANGTIDLNKTVGELGISEAGEGLSRWRRGLQSVTS
jgi:hypothetical protein